jgi:hypothetical protein
MALAGKFLRTAEGGAFLFYCPGCEAHHHITPQNVGSGRGWRFNGSFERPTFTPSVLTGAARHRCHLFVRAGKLIFLGDCVHKLAGKTVDMIDLSAL